MNMQKFVAIVFSILINCAVLALFHVWSTPAVADVAPSTQHTQVVRTLPTITVRPTRAQMQELRRDAKPPKTSGAARAVGVGVQAMVMPFYSFAGSDGVADKS